ncbi:hypothetical protein AB3N59_14275 [Leptospira sp. WS92.C1]
MFLKNRNRVFSGAFFVFVLANCATGNLTITGKPYPALSEVDPIDVILRAAPDYQVEQIGIVEVKCGEMSDCIEYVKEKARENGADVMILAQSGTVTSVQYRPGMNVGNTSTPGHMSTTTDQIQTWEISKKVKNTVLDSKR